MPERNRWIVAALLLPVGLAVAACTEPAAGQGVPPAVVEQDTGGAPPRITLTESGAERTGIQTEPVGPQSPVTVPYRALLYDPDGATWVYTNPEGLTFVRQQVTVDAIVGDQATLADGPAPGTEVVTVGVAELWGAELGIGQ